MREKSRGQSVSVLKMLKQIFTKKNSKIDLQQMGINELFEEIGDTHLKKERMRIYLEEVKHREEEAKKYEALDEEVIKELNLLANKAKSLEEKKQNLKGRLIRNNAALMRVAKYEEELPDMLQEMKQVEKRKRECENNIFYLKEEQEELIEERQSMLWGYKFLKGFSIVLILSIGIGLLILIAFMQMLRESIWGYLSGIGVITVLFIAGFIFTKDRLDRELEKNKILQKKAVRYLNKFKIKYFHQVQYLEFLYQKLGVESTAQLELYYNRYLKNKNNEKMYNQMNNTLTDVEEKMIALLKERGIEVDYIDDLNKWILTPQKISIQKGVLQELEKTKEQILALEAYEAELWKEVFVMKEDKSLESEVQKHIASYEQTMGIDKVPKGA